MNPQTPDAAQKPKTFTKFGNPLKKIADLAGIQVVPGAPTVSEVPQSAVSPNISPSAPQAVKVETTPVDFGGMGERSAPDAAPTAGVVQEVNSDILNREESMDAPKDALDEMVQGNGLGNSPAAGSTSGSPEATVSPSVDSNDLRPQEFRVTDSARVPDTVNPSPPDPIVVPVSPSVDSDSPKQASLSPAPETAPEAAIVPEVRSEPEPEAQIPPQPTFVSEPAVEPKEPEVVAPDPAPVQMQPEVQPVNEQATSSINLIKDSLFWANREKYLTPDGRLDKAKLNADVEQAEKAELLKKNPLLASDLESEGISVPKAA